VRYQQAFGYFINRPGGFVNLLLVMVCQFIPILGPIVLLGYRAEVSVALSNDPELQQHPKFTFDRFVEYLSRGVWPFLIGLILAIPMFPILVGALIAGFAIDPPGPGNPPILAFALFGSALIVTSMALATLSVPMSFHAEMTGKFDLGGAFRFAAEFWRLLFGLAIVTGLIFTILAWVVSMLGILCCIVGIYPANSLILFAGQHLMVQLYREYLDRGGEPLVEYVSEERDDDSDLEEWDDDRGKEPPEKW
jgi:hypothetical protein